MRGAFGLVGLLVGVGIMLWMFSQNEVPVLREGEKTRQEASHLSGRGEDGTAAQDSITLEPLNKAGKFNALRVTTVMASGPMAEHFGLQVGDEILKVGDLSLTTVAPQDPDLAKAQVYDAFRQSQPLVVMRDGNEITLPLAKQKPATPGPTVMPVPKTKVRTLQDQVNDVTAPR